MSLGFKSIVRRCKTLPVRPVVLKIEQEVHHKIGFISKIDLSGNLFSIAAINSLPGVTYSEHSKKRRTSQKPRGTQRFERRCRPMGVWWRFSLCMERKSNGTLLPHSKPMLLIRLGFHSFPARASSEETTLARWNAWAACAPVASRGSWDAAY